MKKIVTKYAPEAIGPYSQGVICKNLIFVSGQLPITEGVLEKEPYKATLNCLNNILEIVKEGGGNLENISKVNVFVKNIEDFKVVNEAYEIFFKNHKPARAFVEVSNLPKDSIIEIEAIAVL